MESLAAIILAAGKGRRINARKVNKVVLPLGSKPMIVYAVDLLERLRISPIVVVVGFAKKSVIHVLKSRVIYAQQRKRLGTAHAVLCALKYLPKNISDVLVLNGDDSAFYKEETVESLITIHQKHKPSITFLTIEVDNPSGLGRIVSDDRGRLVGVTEDKDAKDAKGELRKINEVNPACYVFNVKFLREHLTKIRKSKITGEYYLTSLIDVAIKNNERVETLRAGKIAWRGINTVEELKEAERVFELFREFTSEVRIGETVT